jgi:hypothetical protein
VNPDDQTVRLLDAAVPTIPSRLRTPPYEQIRARARRRRLARGGSASAVVAMLVASVILAVTGVFARPATDIGGGPATTAPPNTPISPGGAAVPIQEARLDRAGTGLTLYLNPPGDCAVYGNANQRVIEGDATVTLFISASPLPVDCSRAMVTRVDVALSSPLGARPLRDGDTGATIPVFRDADLPRVPRPWTEVHNDFVNMNGTAWATGFTRPGGPDLDFLASRGQVEPASVERIQLGRRHGVIAPFGDHSYEVDWVVGDLLYQMRLSPSEGGSVSLAQTHAIIAQLAWP